MKIYPLLFALFLPFVAIGQSLKSYERAGDRAFEKKDFGAAIQYYQTVLAGDDGALSARWKYAESAVHFYAYPEAERAFLKILSAKNGAAKFPLLRLRLGEVAFLQGKYAEARGHFEQFLAKKPAGTTPDDLALAQKRLDDCQFAEQLVAAAKPATVAHLGKEVNSPFSDFAPVVRGDTLYFSSYKFDKKGDRSQPKTKLTRMQMSLKNGRARDVGRNFPAFDSVHIANGAMSRDGHFFFFTECKPLNASELRCEIWLTVKNTRGLWSRPQRLPDGINQKGATATHPAIEYGGAGRSGQALWFASDRPGGQGKLDLWRVPLDSAWFCPCIAGKFDGKKDPKLPDFAAPTNAASLNTPGNDATPFFHAPSQTLFFSSDGRQGLGGYDIFSAKKLPDGALAAPENAGAGLNSSYNDLYPALRPDGRSGYFSSNRPGVFYLDETSKACCHDIFAFQLPAPEPPKPPSGDPLLTTKSATEPLPTAPAVSEAAPVPVPKFEPPKLADFVGLPLYFDNDEPDKRTRRTATKKTYEETALAYLERQEEYRERFAQGLSGDRKDAADDAIDGWFEDEVRRGYDRLFQLTELIFNRLQAGERVEVVVKGFTSPRAQTDYNLNLGKRRISSVRNHFEAWSEGALQPFIGTGQFKISEASFGETTARAGISDDLKDERNSVYHPDAARERRVEIVEIRQ